MEGGKVHPATSAQLAWLTWLPLPQPRDQDSREMSWPLHCFVAKGPVLSQPATSSSECSESLQKLLGPHQLHKR